MIFITSQTKSESVVKTEETMFLPQSCQPCVEHATLVPEVHCSHFSAPQSLHLWLLSPCAANAQKQTLVEYRYNLK